jgi:hypothetical protein
MVKYKWSLFIGVLLFISCSDDEGTPASKGLLVCFSSDLSERTVSRAADESWDAGDQVGVYMVPHVADASAAADFSVYTGAVNVPYVTSGSGKSVSLSVMSRHDAIVYPKDGSRVNFVAYYPYKSDTHTTNANVYKVDVSRQSPSGAIDLLYHKGAGTPYDYSNKDTDVSLAFTHQLSKMKINLVPDLGMGTNLSTATVTLSGFPATADFNLSTGVLSNPGGAIPSLTPVRNGSASSANQAVFEAIVVPHSGTSYTRTVTFTIGGQVYPYTLTASDGFKQGMAYDYIFKFTGKDVVLAGNTLINWKGVGDGSPGYLLTASQSVFNLTTDGVDFISGVPLRVNLLTTAPDKLTCITSLQSDAETSVKPDWITPTLSAGTTSNGWVSYTLTFTVGLNTSGGSQLRTGYILIRAGGLTLPVTVNQAGVVLFHDRVNPTAEDIALPSIVGSGSFAVATDSSQPPVIRYSINGNLAYATDDIPDWLTISGITSSAYTGNGKTGTQYTAAYSYTKNTETQDRVCYVHVIVQGDMNAALRFKITQAAPPYQADTSVADGMTNCYVIIPGNGMTFPVSRAYVYDEQQKSFTDALRVDPNNTYTEGFGVDIVWADANVIEDIYVTGKGNKSVVHLKVLTNKGNAVIKIYKINDNAKTPVWSYHIWVTDLDPNTNEKYNENGFTIMNMNLGATDKTALSGMGTGLFYQWGRKDPFPATGAPGEQQPGTGTFTTTEVSSNELIYTITHPNVFLWRDFDSWTQPVPIRAELWGRNSGKTIYDPCPSGWRVFANEPGTHPWVPTFDNSNSTLAINAQGGVYSMSGCRDVKGNLRFVDEYCLLWIGSDESWYYDKQIRGHFYCIKWIPESVGEDWDMYYPGLKWVGRKNYTARKSKFEASYYFCTSNALSVRCVREY